MGNLLWAYRNRKAKILEIEAFESYILSIRITPKSYKVLGCPSRAFIRLLYKHANCRGVKNYFVETLWFNMNVGVLKRNVLVHTHQTDPEYTRFLQDYIRLHKLVDSCYVNLSWTKKTT
jgi:hypothetical protein